MRSLRELSSPLLPLPVRPLKAAVAAVFGSTSFAAVAVAQTDVRTVALEEIVVTASKRETSVQELPFNIAAVSGDVLERQRLTDLAEFAPWVPGLTLVDQGPRAGDLMTVRGLNVRSLHGSEFLGNGSGGTVATYLGEIPLYVDLKMKDLDRVEVLLGPQGTLYGEGTLAGAVRYIPRRPSTTETTFDAHARTYAVAESEGFGYEADFTVNVPIAENLAFRGVVSYLDDPGFIDYPYVVRVPGVSDPEPDMNDPAAVAANLRRVEDADAEETVSARMALLWEITDSVEATFNYYFQDQDVGARTVNHRDSFATGQYESGHRVLEPQQRDNRLFSTEVIADLGFAELTSATGLSELEQAGQRDQTDLVLTFPFGYSDFPSFVAYTRDLLDEERVSQEVRLVSTGDGPWSWIGGVFYNEHSLEGVTEEHVPGYPEFIGEPDNLEYWQLTTEELTERAVFGELGYQLTDAWQVTIGGRWFEYEDETFIAVEFPLAGASGGSQANDIEDDGFLGKLNTSYRFSDEVTGYLTVSEGFRIGGANPQPLCPEPLPPGPNACALPDEVLIDPDTTTNYEIGMHGVWRGGDLLLDAAVYYVDWNDVQTRSTTVNGSLPIIANGGGARSRGVELAVQTPNVGRWSLRAAYAYNESELTTFAPGLVDGADAFPGDRLAGTPEHQGSFFADYSQPLANGWDLRFGYGLTFRSNVLTKVGLRNNGETLGGYALHNASVGVSEGSWSAVLYADNLTNKYAETGVRYDPTYIDSIDDFTARFYFRNVIRPRTIGIEFRYRIGD